MADAAPAGVTVIVNGSARQNVSRESLAHCRRHAASSAWPPTWCRTPLEYRIRPGALRVVVPAARQ